MTRGVPVAVVGMGGIFPSPDGWTDLDGFARMVEAGVSAARPVPAGRWRLDPAQAFDPGPVAADRAYSTRGCFIEGFRFDPRGLDLDPDLVARLDPVFHLALHAGREAWDSAATAGLDRSRVSVVLGNIALPTDGASALAEEVLGPLLGDGRDAAGTPSRPLDRWPAGLPAGLLARGLGLGGGSLALDAACASSLYAIALAMEELRAGRVDAVLAGGLSRPACLYTQMGFSQLRALSRRGVCSPFDEEADGLVVGEGAGIFVLKRLDDALRQGDRIHGVLRAAGLSNDLQGSLLAPSSEGQGRALRRAYREAGWEPGSVDLVECHATGTPVGDAEELRSLRELRGDAAAPCVIGSVKSNVGHLLTGAGAAGLAKVLLALRRGVLPPTANYRRAAAASALEGGPLRVLSRAEPWERRAPGEARRAAVSAFGFGGINAHLLVEEHLAGAPAPLDAPAPPRAPGAGPIAVVGMAARLGPWTSLRAFQERVLGGGPEAAPAPPTRAFGAALPPGHFVDEVRIPAERFRIPPRELEEMLPQQALMLLAAGEALEDAGARSGAPDPETGVFVGMGLDLNTTNFHLRWAGAGASQPPLTANRTVGALGGMVASRIAREFRFGGPSFAVHAEDASGLRAVEVAVRMLREGRIDRALAGAVDLAGDPRAALGFDALRPFSPDGEARPFDADASGTVPGEGAAAVVLKRLEDAIRDGDRIHAVLRGVGASSGGAGAERPPAGAIARALERAWGDAGLEPAAAGYLEAHGSGDPAEDAEEARAIVEVFGNRAGRPPLVVGSAKALVGHAGAASGLAGLVRAALCLRQEVLPALPGTRAPLAGFAEAAERFRLPAEPQAWVRDRADGPRRAAVTALSIDGNCAHAVLEAFEDPNADLAAADLLRPLGALPEAVFAVEADAVGDVDAGLASLAEFAREAPRGAGPEDLARRWLARRAPAPSAAYGAAVVARGAAELADLAGAARRAVRDGTPSAGDRVFWSPEPLGGDLALVFPGSGNHFPGMGRALGLAWPEVLRAQDARTLHLRGQLAPEVFWDAASREDLERDPRALIFGQVALKTLVADALAAIGVRPRAAIGYSLGETAALFSLGAWRDRDGMWRRMRDSTLFTRDLAGPCRAARRAWGLGPDEPVEWTVGVVDRDADEVRRALRGRRRAYLLVVNAPGECVVGGSRLEVESLVRDLGAAFHAVGGVTTVHCEVAGEVEEAYRDLHLQETHPVAGVRFYSGARGGAFEPDRESAADAITAQALDTLDFARVVEAAWSDGARFFLETGPGASCTRMIGRILDGRPFAARAVAVPHRDETGSMLRAAAHLVAERLPVDLAALHGRVPPPPIETAPGRTIVLRTGGDPPVPPAAPRPSFAPSAPRPAHAPGPALAALASTTSAVAVLEAPSPAAAFEAISRATVSAHERWLAFADAVQRTIARAAGAPMAAPATMPVPAPVRPRPVPAADLPFLDHAACLEFARGSIGKVLGPEWAEVDAHPTRVRLPDGPLLLCHRVLRVEGTPRSLGAGRVVTAHDVLPDAWYLDGGRIPTGVAVEAGQADLFLSAWLGIDFATRGRAVYRLLDAEVAFHGPLPGPGSVIEYDIRIERFFRQGETHLFRFRFDGTVDGRPFLTMRDGCAGFFTPEELAAGRGLVRPTLGPPGARDLAPPPWMPPLPAGPSSLDAAGVDALRRGDLAAAFGAPFGALPIAKPAALPGGKMALVHRLPLLDPTGGPAGRGLARGETDIRPGDWFLECHFTDDRVMPGTLMYETCLQVLRALLLRRGWVAESGAAAWEPVPGAASRLRCRGQVTESTRVVSYEVAVRSLSYGPEPRCVADALMLADGKPIVEMTGITVRLSGTDEGSLRAAWETALAPKPAPAAAIAAAPRPALYGKARILAFSNGNPSEAFGEPYRPFDRDRVIARLPGPPFQFLDRITAVQGEPWTMAPGVSCEAQHDVDPAAWYFADARAPRMPFAVLLEVALQPCGWLAAYMGSALASESDLRFRNLGGSGIQHREVGPDAGVLAVRAACTGVSSSGGMIIQHYDFAVHDARGPVYEGTTYFGFFADEALANQVGIRDADPWRPSPEEAARGRAFEFPRRAPFPGDRLRRIDRVELLVPDGGPAALGFLRGTQAVDPEAWYFKAHFLQDPVAPGSLGIEAFLQALQALAAERFGEGPFSAVTGRRHEWKYRGQIVQRDRLVTVEASVADLDEARRAIVGDGFLSVDGRVIYGMTGFGVRRTDS